jgi:hypothetical protein
LLWCAGTHDARAQLTVANTRDLGFGAFVAGSGGMLTMAPNGARSATGSVLPLSIGSGSSALFTVSTADPLMANTTFSISLPVNGEVTLTNGPHQMPVLNFVSTPAGAAQLSGMWQSFTVGATLAVGANQEPGTYTGTFTVTVNHN